MATILHLDFEKHEYALFDPINGVHRDMYHGHYTNRVALVARGGLVDERTTKMRPSAPPASRARRHSLLTALAPGDTAAQDALSPCVCLLVATCCCHLSLFNLYDVEQHIRDALGSRHGAFATNLGHWFATAAATTLNNG